MAITVNRVVASVRELVQDTFAGSYRYTDDFIIDKMNMALKRMVIIRPDLFVEVEALSCVVGTLQRAPVTSVRMIDVLDSQTGGSVKEITQEVLDMMAPNWPNGTTGTVSNWMRYPRDPNRFFVYPPVAAAASILIAYAKCPSDYVAGDTIALLGDAYLPVLMDATVWVMESIDAEHVESGRAKMFKDSFMEMLTTGLSSRRLTDNDKAGLPAEESL